MAKTLQVPHKSADRLLADLLTEITRLTLLLDDLHARSEQRSSGKGDREICKTAALLDQAYDRATRAGVVPGTAYRTSLADGTEYSLCLTQWGVECRPQMAEQVA